MLAADALGERIGGRRKRDRQGDYAAPSISEIRGRVVFDDLGLKASLASLRPLD